MSNQVVRGSWFSDAQYVRAAARNWNVPNLKYIGLGFRLVLKSRRDCDQVVRGSTWGYGAPIVRAAYRSRGVPDSRYFDLGFRLVLRSSK